MVLGVGGVLYHEISRVFVGAKVEGMRGSGANDHRRQSADRPQKTLGLDHPQERLAYARPDRGRSQTLHSRLQEVGSENERNLRLA